MIKTTLEGGDDYEIIGSSSVISYNLKPIKIRVSEDGDKNPLYLIFEFESDDKDESARVASLIANNTLTLRVINYNSTLGSGSGKPLRIGYTNDRAIFLNYRIFTLSPDADKTIQYTLYSQLTPKKESSEAKK